MVRLRVEHRDDELDGTTRREVLAAISPQVGTDALRRVRDARLEDGDVDLLVRAIDLDLEESSSLVASRNLQGGIVNHATPTPPWAGTRGEVNHPEV